MVVEVTARKPFLGGYCHRVTGVEYHHASTQTDARNRRNSSRRGEKVSFSVQATPCRSQQQQTNRESSSQTPLEIPSEGPRQLAPSGQYISSKEWLETRTAKRAFRRWLKARNVFHAQQALLMSVALGLDDAESQDSSDHIFGEASKNEEKAEAAAKEISEKEAYQKMLAELERRTKEEAEEEVVEDEQSKRKRKATEIARKAREFAVQAAARQQQAKSDSQAVLEHILIKAGQPKIWMSSRRYPIFVETPSTTRAKQLASVYVRLEDSHTLDLGDDDRARALVDAITMMDSIPESPDKRELLALISREVDLTKRDVKTKNLLGLRKRITYEYSRIIRSPEVNPEIQRFEKLLPQGLLLPRPRLHGQLSDEHVTEFCPRCCRHLPREKFGLSASGGGAAAGAAAAAGSGGGSSGGSGSGGRCCRLCQQMENNALATVAQETLAAFKAMTEDIKRAEEEKDNTTSPVFQLQDADIHYIVQNFWDGQSVLSGCKELRSLALARWIKDRDWAPWNCVLLTKDEAEIHETIGDVEEVYGPLLVEKIRHKHILAGNHFSKMSAAAKYSRPGWERDEEEKLEEKTKDSSLEIRGRNLH